MAEPQFTVDAVLSDARDAVGLADFGDTQFLGPLERWLQAQRDEARMSNEGRVVAFRQASQHLQTRLLIEDHFARYPEIAEERIEAPVFVVGLYRSGTTKLHRLLCSDTRWRYLQTWQVMYPAPFDDILAGAPDRRRDLTQQRLDRLARSSQGALDAHPMSVDDAEEDWLLMAQTFLVPNIGQHTPRYSRWLEQQDATPMYRYLHRQLQILQWQERVNGDEARRFCLKAPIHLEFIDALLSVFPDARVIFTHRDPVKSIASNCLMMEAYQRKYVDDIDLIELGREVLHKSVVGLDNSLRSREAFARESFFEVTFADVVERPLEVMPDVYRFVGMDLDDHAMESLRRGDDDGERHKSSARHQYDPARYGLDDDVIYERTRGYLDWVNVTVGVDLRE
jgi:hypothetical protein